MTLNRDLANKIIQLKIDGQLTDDKIVELGLEHKKLPANEKSWKEFGELVGMTGTSDAIRNYINSHAKKLNINTMFDEEDVEKQKARDEISSYRRYLRDYSRVDEFKQAIIDSINDLNELPHISYDSSKSPINTTEAVLMLSDWHIGVDCDNFYNKYNYKIAEERVCKLVNNVINYCALNHVSKLSVVGLGDFIHGIIHTNARIEQEFDVTEQIIKSSELLASALNYLQYSAPEVVYRSCTDNHSRAVSNKDEAIEQENFVKITDWYLKERLRGSKITFADDNLDCSMGLFTLKNGKKVMFSHGHRDNIRTAFNHFVGATKSYIDYILLAHWHCEKSDNIQNTKVIVNGSLVGSEQYAVQNRLFSEPSQTLLIFDRDNMMNISINVK